VGVTLEQRDAGKVVVVDGDLACPATLVALYQAFVRIGFTGPVVVDLSEATGSSPEITRLLDRTARLMSHRGIPFTIDLSGRSEKSAAYAS
jgi:hypothetical protein